MADIKISALPSLASGNADLNDYLPVVSDYTGSLVTYKMTLSELRTELLSTDLALVAGVDLTLADGQIDATVTGAALTGIVSRPTHATYTGASIASVVTRAASSAFKHIHCSSNGAVVFSVDGAGTVTVPPAQGINASNYTSVAGAGAMNFAVVDASVMNFNIGGVTRFQIGTTTVSVSPMLLVGTSVTTSASAGDVVLASTNYLRSVNNAGTGTFGLIRGNGDRVQVSDGTVPVSVGATIITSASAGEVVLASTNYLRSVNNAGTSTFGLIRGNGDRVQVSDGTVPVSVGATIITGANAGDVVLANGNALRGVNAAGTNTLQVAYLNGSDHVQVGGGSMYVHLGQLPAASLAAGGVAMDGSLMFDSTNNRLVFYSGGNRYYLTGIAF